MLNQIKQLTDPRHNKPTEKQTHMASALLLKKRQEFSAILAKIGDTKPMQYVFNEVNTLKELTTQMYSRIDKKWIPVGICGIGAAGAVIGLSYWLLRNRTHKKEQIVKEFLSAVRKEALKQKPSASRLNQIGNKLIEECNKYIFVGKGGIEKEFRLVNENNEYARQFAARACEVLLEIVSEAIQINPVATHQSNTPDNSNNNKSDKQKQPNEIKVWEETIKLILQLFMNYLALAKKHSCPLLTGLIGRVISTDIQPKKSQLNVPTPTKESNDSAGVQSSWLKVVIQNSGYLSHSAVELLKQFIGECTEDIHLHFHTLIAANSYQLVQQPVSILPNILYNLSSSQMDSLVDSGGAIAIVASFCGLLQQQNSQLLEFSAPISILLPLAKLVIQAGLRNVLFRDIAAKLLLEALAFSETAETTTIKADSNVVDLVQWSTSHLGFILTRLQTSRIIEGMLLTILSYDETCPKQVGSRYIDQLRWMHKIRQTDASKGFQQFDIDLSTSAFFPQILLHSIKQLPTKENLNSSFTTLIPCIDDQERTVILKTITMLFHNYFFTKEIFHSMLQKTSSLNAADIMTFADFSQAFYSPKGKKYDESLLALQFAVLLGGGDVFSENLAKRWKKDAVAYHDFKIYMESDIAFFLQVLENDLCFLNVNASEFSTINDASAVQVLQLNTQHKIQKLLVNYLHIFGALDKDSLKQQLKNQIAGSILDDETLFSDALSTVAVLNESGPKRGFYQLKETMKLKFFHSLFSRDIPLLINLLDRISDHQKHAGFVLNHDLHTEAQLREEDEPLVYLKQVRKCILENIQLHTAFREIFIEKEDIFLDKMRVACRILHYIFDIIEEGIIASRATKKLSSNSIKSLLVQYVFDPVIAEKIDHVTSLRDEKGHVIVSAFAPTLNNIIFRREAIKDLLKDIFKGFKISDIIV